MNKQEFFDLLRSRLGSVPEKELEARLEFYAEMIDDRMEDGLSEHEAISALGSVDEIANQTLSEIPLGRLAKERIKPKRRLKVWEIVLLALGSPIWISLIASAVVVVISVYASIWAAVASLWSVFGALSVFPLVGIVSGVASCAEASVGSGIALFGASVACVGMAILAFFGCLAATKGMSKATKAIALCIKKIFVKKEESK